MASLERPYRLLHGFVSAARRGLAFIKTIVSSVFAILLTLAVAAG